MNVLVSAMLSGGGAPDMTLQLVLQGAAALLADSRVLAEYDEVTARSLFAFDEDERRLLLDTLAAIAEPVVTRPVRLTLPDPDDRVFVEVALAGQAVLTPRQFVDRMRR